MTRPNYRCHHYIEKIAIYNRNGFKLHHKIILLDKYAIVNSKEFLDSWCLFQIAELPIREASVE